MVATTYTFVCKYGNQTIRPVDMDAIRDRVAEWERSVPPPVPPLIAPEYWRENAKEMLVIKEELGCSRKEAIEEWKRRQEPVLDEKDKDYLEKKRAHNSIRYIYTASEVILDGVLIHDGISLRQAVEQKLGSDKYKSLKKIKEDREEYKRLFQFIFDNSELNEKLIERKIDEFGYKWNGRSLVEIWKDGGIPKGDTSSNWKAMGAVAAMEVESIGPVKYGRLEIDEQASIIAIYLAQSWLTALDGEKRRLEAEQKRKQGKKSWM